MEQYLSELGLPKGMLELLPGITQARVVAQGGLSSSSGIPVCIFVGLKRTWDQKLSSGLTSGSLHSAITAWFFPTYMSFHLTAVEQSCCSL